MSNQDAEQYATILCSAVADDEPILQGNKIMNIEKTRFYLSDGEISVWVEQEAIHIKAIDKSGDPVEITKDRALELAEALKQLAATIADCKLKRK